MAGVLYSIYLGNHHCLGSRPPLNNPTSPSHQRRKSSLRRIVI